MNSRDHALELEYLLRLKMVGILQPSASKQVAMDKKFWHFADVARALQRKAPKEFVQFVNELDKRLDIVATYRAPRGSKIVPAIYHDENGSPRIYKWPNGKPKYRLATSPKLATKMGQLRYNESNVEDRIERER